MEGELQTTQQSTDEFGGYSKAWLAENECHDLDSISAMIGINIEKKAQALVNVVTPGDSKRKIAIKKEEIKLSPLRPALPTPSPFFIPADLECFEQPFEARFEDELDSISRDYWTKLSRFSVKQAQAVPMHKKDSVFMIDSCPGSAFSIRQAAQRSTMFAKGAQGGVNLFGAPQRPIQFLSKAAESLFCTEQGKDPDSDNEEQDKCMMIPYGFSLDTPVYASKLFE